MSNYVVNGAIGGYTQSEIDNPDLISTENNVVVILDEKTNDKLHKYYTAIRNLITKNTRVILIMVGKSSKISKIVCNLMGSYDKYDIYQVDELMDITPTYTNDLLEREPTREEVQTFFNCEIIAHSKVNEILAGIQSLAEEGDIEQLKDFINSQGDTIFSVMAVVENMRNIAEAANMGNAEKHLRELMDMVESLKTDVETKTRQISNLTESEARLSDELSTTKRESSRLRNQVESSQGRKDGGGAILNYVPYSTSVKNCKTKHVIYFKEISQIPFINSLVIHLIKQLDLFNLNYKVLIYDNHNRFSGMYAGLGNIGGSDVASQLSRGVIKSTKTPLVVTEPNQAIIQNVLNQDNPIIDVVLIYDRLGEPNRDIVEGNQVTKFWVINSVGRELQARYLMNVTKDNIITRPSENTSGEYIDIPEIPQYKTMTDSGKTSKYIKLLCQGSRDINVIKTIIAKARIESKRA